MFVFLLSVSCSMSVVANNFELYIKTLTSTPHNIAHTAIRYWSNTQAYVRCVGGAAMNLLKCFKGSELSFILVFNTVCVVVLS